MKTIWEKLDAIHGAEFLAEQFPRFITAFGPLHEAIEKVFACNLTEDAYRADIIIYGLGRLCLEDFAEILFLAQHDYGYAAIKLLRGLYERVVVNETIAENPEVEGARFFDYFAVDDRKFNRRATDVFSNWAVDPNDMKDSFDTVIDQYKYEPCHQCGQTPQRSWTKHALDSLAGNLGKTTNNPNLQELGKQLRKCPVDRRK